MHKVFDVIKCKDQMYLFLGKYKIFENNRIISNYRNNDTDRYVYVKLSNIPKTVDKSIIFSDYYLFELLKNKKHDDDVVARLSMKLFDNIELHFIDKSFTIRKKYETIDLKDVELLNSINDKNYMNVVNLINNVNNLSFDFNYNKKTKLYANTISYYDKKYYLNFINDNFIFSILNPLIATLTNNNECSIYLGKDGFVINSNNSFNIIVHNFNEEIILYLVANHKMMDNNKRI